MASEASDLRPEQREALVSLWAEIFTAEIRELSTVTVASPSGRQRSWQGADLG